MVIEEEGGFRRGVAVANFNPPSSIGKFTLENFPVTPLRFLLHKTGGNENGATNFSTLKKEQHCIAFRVNPNLKMP